MAGSGSAVLQAGSEEELVRSAEQAGVRVYGLSESMDAEPACRTALPEPATVLMGFGAYRTGIKKQLSLILFQQNFRQHHKADPDGRRNGLALSC